MSGTSPSDVWAVGTYDPPSAAIQDPFAEHWDGSTWSLVPVPPANRGNNALTGVVAIAPNDVWSVGAYNTQQAAFTLIEHWNGSVWNVISSPTPAGSQGVILRKVEAASSQDVWAVGGAYIMGDKTLIEHRC